jgi:hypothetical protein
LIITSRLAATYIACLRGRMYAYAASTLLSDGMYNLWERSKVRTGGGLTRGQTATGDDNIIGYAKPLLQCQGKYILTNIRAMRVKIEFTEDINYCGIFIGYKIQPQLGIESIDYRF